MIEGKPFFLGLMIEKDEDSPDTPCDTCPFSALGGCPNFEAVAFHWQMNNAGARTHLIEKIAGVAIFNAHGIFKLAHPDFSGVNHYVRMLFSRRDKLPVNIPQGCPQLQPGLIRHATLFFTTNLRGDH
jgi:hypothetical protein